MESLNPAEVLKFLAADLVTQNVLLDKGETFFPNKENRKFVSPPVAYGGDDEQKYTYNEKRAAMKAALAEWN